MNYKLIAFDLDGTVLNSNSHISDQTRTTFEKAIQQGIHIAIASGRCRSALPADIEQIQGLQYAITSNGSSIFQLPDYKRVYGIDMQPATLKAVHKLLKAYGCLFEVFIKGQGYTLRSYYDDPVRFGVPERMRTYVHNTRTPVDNLLNFLEEHLYEIEAIDMIIPDPVEKAAFLKDLRTIPDMYITSSESYYIEIADGAVSKASALHALAQMLGIDRKDVLAFGDGGNDIEMIKYAGCGVAMKNAAPHLKEAADAETLSNDEDGVAFYIENVIFA